MKFEKMGPAQQDEEGSQLQVGPVKEGQVLLLWHLYPSFNYLQLKVPACLINSQSSQSMSIIYSKWTGQSRIRRMFVLASCYSPDLGFILLRRL